MSNSNMVLERRCDRARRIDEQAWANPSSPHADEPLGIANAWNRIIAFRKAVPMLYCCPFGGRPLVIFLCLGALLACVGCGEKRAEVSGKVTVDGKPLNSKLITILFAPDKDNPIKKIPAAAVDENGNYTMMTGATGGVPLGWYRVHVHWDSKNAQGQRCPVHPRFLEAGLTTLSIEVVANPQPGAYDLKFTRN
jgi:hypothetical protein